MQNEAIHLVVFPNLLVGNTFLKQIIDTSGIDLISERWSQTTLASKEKSHVAENVSVVLYRVIM